MASDKLRRRYKELHKAQKEFNSEDDVVRKTELANQILDLDKEILELEEREGKYT